MEQQHLAILLIVLSYGAANATSIISENFDSYADTAALGAVWNLSSGTLSTSSGNPGAALNHLGSAGSFTGGNTSSLSFPEVYPGAGQVLTFSVDIFDAGGANQRNSAGLRGTGSANILELGLYNSPSHYAFRTILFGTGATNWVAFSNIVDDLGSAITNEPLVGWHRFIAEFTESELTVSLDLNADGNINASTTVTGITPQSGTGFNVVRLGGPSDLSSPGGGAQFDNVSINLNAIPEPSTSLLVLSVLLGFSCRRQR